MSAPNFLKDFKARIPVTTALHTTNPQPTIPDQLKHTTHAAISTFVPNSRVMSYQKPPFTPHRNYSDRFFSGGNHNAGVLQIKNAQPAPGDIEKLKTKILEAFPDDFTAEDLTTWLGSLTHRDIAHMLESSPEQLAQQIRLFLILKNNNVPVLIAFEAACVYQKNHGTMLRDRIFNWMAAYHSLASHDLDPLAESDQQDIKVRDECKKRLIEILKFIASHLSTDPTSILVNDFLDIESIDRTGMTLVMQFLKAVLPDQTDLVNAIQNCLIKKVHASSLFE